MVSTDSCLAVSMKLQVLTMRISASSGWAVSRAPARSSMPIITSESTRFFGQPREMKPTVGGAGGEVLVTVPLYRGVTCEVGSWKIAEPLTPAGIARMVLFILEQPAHARIP